MCTRELLTSSHSIRLPYQGPLQERHEKEHSHCHQQKVTIRYEELRELEVQYEVWEYFHTKMLVGHHPRAMEIVRTMNNIYQLN